MLHSQLSKLGHSGRPFVLRQIAPRGIRPLTVRQFSKSPQTRQLSGLKIPPWATFANAKKYWPQLAAAAGGLVVIYGLSSVVFWVGGTLMVLNFEDFFWFGFGTGIVSAQ